MTFLITHSGKEIYLNAEDIEEAILDLRKKGYLGKVTSIFQVEEDGTYQRVSEVER